MLSLTYFSTAVEPFTREQLEALLEHSRARNHERDLTGLLLYAGGHFIQTLEGPNDVVDQTFMVIQDDPRHRDVFISLREKIAERVFPDWSMGFEQLDPEQAVDLPGFNDYLESTSELYRNTDRLGRPGIFHRIFRDHMR
jgi:hypothetical protein